MRELKGVMAAYTFHADNPNIKQRALMFDAIHVLGLASEISKLEDVMSIHSRHGGSSNWPELRAELDYLISSKFLLDAPIDETEYRNEHTDALLYGDLEVRQQHSRAVRLRASKLATASCNVIPIFDSIDSFYFASPTRWSSAPPPNLSVFSVALNAFCAFDSETSWECIFAFKEEMRNKQWGLRRFLFDLANKRQTDAEIRDDIEWSLNEYSKAMELHHLKAGSSFAEVYLIPAVEVLEDVAKFNWSKIAKGALSIKKRQVELLEAEMKAPGREVAYIYDATKRFADKAAGLP